MRNLPFIIPNLELNFRISMILIILLHLSTTKKGNMHLTIDRINMYDFLLKHPQVLKELLKKEKKKELILQENEFNNVEELFPNYSFQTKQKEIKKILIILSSFNYVSISIEKDIFFTITEEGINSITEVDAEFKKRADELCILMKSLQSMSTNQLHLKVQNIIKGETNR
ncbi:ABC-three component system middle component 4 [Bacillus tropicus]|uniref:ABC-three component system middle component 4 n=1 Tax=Bacillus tropicus TaxID=2026188 RepID=UPI001CFF09C6|nr:ABC-three component system middle component 4 [Bacillus tropicus]